MSEIIDDEQGEGLLLETAVENLHTNYSSFYEDFINENRISQNPNDLQNIIS